MEPNGICTTLEFAILIKNADIVKFIKLQRIRWLGHVYRTDEHGTLKTSQNGNLIKLNPKEGQESNG